MIQRVRECGEGKAGCIFWVLLFGITALAAFKMIPVRVQVGVLTDFMDEQAKHGPQSNEKMHKAIMDRASDLNLPLEREKLTVRFGRGRVKMEASLTIPIEFPGYTYNWDFHILIDEPKFRI